MWSLLRVCHLKKRIGRKKDSKVKASVTDDVTETESLFVLWRHYGQWGKLWTDPIAYQYLILCLLFNLGVRPYLPAIAQWNAVYCNLFSILCKWGPCGVSDDTVKCLVIIVMVTGIYSEPSKKKNQQFVLEEAVLSFLRVANIGFLRVQINHTPARSLITGDGQVDSWRQDSLNSMHRNLNSFLYWQTIFKLTHL